MKIKILSVIFVFLSLIGVSHAQNSSLWKLGSGLLSPVVNSWGLRIPSLGSAGSPCLRVDGNGTFATSTCESPLTFTTPNLERSGNSIFFRNFSVFLGQGGRATLAHNNAMNTASFSYTHLVSRPQGNAFYSTGKGGVGDDFYFNIVVNTSGGVVANMKKTPQNVSATAPSGTIGSRNWHKIRLSYNDATDRKLYLYVDDVLVATSTAFSTGTAFSNTHDFLWDMGQGVTYFTRPIFSSDPDYNPDMANVVTDADTIFYFPIRSTKTNPVDTINGWTMSLDSEAKLWFGDELPFGLDGQIQALLDTLNNKIGDYFYWDRLNTGVALLTTTGIPITFLDWESSEWLSFYSEEDGTPQVTGDFNFQDKQRFQATPTAIHATTGDIYVASSTRGIILKSPDGSCARGTISNLDVLTFASVSCP